MVTERFDECGLCRFSPDSNQYLPALRILVTLFMLLAACLPLVGLAQTLSTPLPVTSSNATVSAPLRGFEVIARYPHDRAAFTQGLTFYQGHLYESTGIRGHSSIRRVELESGRVLESRHLDDSLFGEGLAVIDHHLVQLTWQSGKAFMYTPVDLSKTGVFNYSGEGWGAVGINRKLVISDGSARLKFINVGDHRQTGSLSVRDGKHPIEGLNELEWVEGLIFANVYPSDYIAQIDPVSGQVVGWIDLGRLMPSSERADSTAVANGIAYNPETGALFVTGKLWPYIYQLKLMETEVLPDKQAVFSAFSS